MARYYATVTNGRGGVTKAGGRSSVNSAHVRGWDVGVKVETYTGSGRDQLTVYLTHGSHASGSDKLLGTVMLTSDGPVFVPEFPTDDNAPSYIVDLDGE